MNRLKLLLPIVFLLGLLPLASSYTINGTVIDDCTGAVIPNMNIYITNTTTTNIAVTDASGYYINGTLGYSTDDFANGSYTLMYGGETGYRNGATGVTVAGNITQNITIDKSFCAVYATTDVGPSVIDGTITIIIVLVGFASIIGLVILLKFFKGQKIGF